MRTIQLTIDHPPVAKGRPKFARRGKFVTTYTPKKTTDFELIVADCGRNCMEGSDPLDTALSVTVMLYFQIPKSKPKKIKEAMKSGEVRHTSRPDVDNAAKAVLDALNGIVWADDRQIVRLVAEKHYSGYPRIELTVREVVGAGRCD